MNFNGLSAGSNVFQLDPTANVTNADLPMFTLDGSATPLNLSNTDNQGSVGFSVAGLGNVTSAAYDTTGGDDFGLGAPRSDVDGVAKTYIATGAPWIVPGSALEVADLRSDNGFIVPEANRVGNVGDFDGDGYDDYWKLEDRTLETNAFIVSSGTLVKGASIFDVGASEDREVLLAEDMLRNRSLASGDFDGDGFSEIIAPIGGRAAYFDAKNLTDSGELRPTSIASVPLDINLGNLTDIAYFFSADLNGDGFEDLIYQRQTSDGKAANETNTVAKFYLNRADGKIRFDEVTPSFSDFANYPISAIADLDGDGQDEIISNTAQTDDAGNTVYTFKIGKLQNGQIALVGAFEWTDLAPAPYFARDSTEYRGVFLPSAVGDVNGDGREDIVLSAQYFQDVSFFSYGVSSLVIYGAASLGGLTGTTITSDGISDVTFGNPWTQNRGDEYRIKSADIVGDVNHDGYDDVLVGRPAVSDSFIVYGRDDAAGESVALPSRDRSADFEDGYAIRSVSNGSSEPFYLATTVSNGGDLNGDGLDDMMIGAP
ncbi:MAG: VCBS repeat-containing protein, partial [Pseudomonadota bacterium]